MPESRVLLIGWDAADWKVINPLLQAGRMPNLARLIAGGVHGNLATIYPILSPMLWTSIATGKRAFKHGIHGFTEPLPDGSGVRPITLLSRKTKAVWNILNQTGRRSLVVGWWPSHPAEPLNGTMVSNHFPMQPAEPDKLPPLSAGTIHPAALAEELADLRVNPMELTGEFIRMFVPDYEKVDQAKDKRLHSLGKIIAETMSIHAVATELLAKKDWDFAAIYYTGIDHFGHAFMRYHPPQLPSVSDEDFAIYKNVVANAYCYHDAMLGALLDFADEKTTVILMSDHGFHPDHLRPSYIPAEPAGPAIEHRHFGILCMKGPGLRANEKLFGASVLDICPTILALFGLPAGRDMDGKVLLTAFEKPPALEPVGSWDNAPGDAGLHSPETRLDPVASAQAFKQLVELGYVAPPGENAQQNVDECVRELKYNLARSCQDGNCCAQAASIAGEIWTRWPNEHRFGILLIECLAALRRLPERRRAIEELERRIDRFQAEAKEELARRDQQKLREQKEDAAPGGDPLTRQLFEERLLRELESGRPHLIDWFLLSQSLLEKNHDEARRLLQKLSEADTLDNGMNQRLAGALAELGNLDESCALLESVLESDPENAAVHAQLAAIHSKAGRFEKVIASATESLCLLYFQSAVHTLLGGALMETNRFAEAEKELQVAVAQSPRNLAAHELLARLYRDHLQRPQDAFAHEGRARALRHEMLQRDQNGNSEKSIASTPSTESTPAEAETLDTANDELPPPFSADVDARQIITVVSGLPRSGTSMMMQLLVAAGYEALTDASRGADEDNPLGYLEFEKTLAIARDVSWLPQARGKVLKVVAQLLPSLPSNERYNVLFMERNPAEVIASQKAMLARKGLRGAELDDQKLLETYTTQLQRVRVHLARRPDMRVLRVSYAALLADPSAGIDRIARFLGGSFDRKIAAASVRPELQRQRA
jgi:predicted AlkP superfamily phosphohydrolase/phosphomutase/tetratricopeptide (TPR) repeat protein